MCAAQQSADPTSDLPAASKVELPAVSAVELLPARMLNEFVYCPRLFYYEHVEGVFLHSADTKKGAAEHTRVDAGKGELPPAKRTLGQKMPFEPAARRSLPKTCEAAWLSGCRRSSQPVTSSKSASTEPINSRNCDVHPGASAVASMVLV